MKEKQYILLVLFNILIGILIYYIRVLSIGTGRLTYKENVNSSTKWGMIQWTLKGDIFDRILQGKKCKIE